MSDDDALPLSREESRQLAEQLAVLAKAGLPLASGLRAAAEEMPSRRLAAAMSAVAERLERGRSLDDVLRGSPRLMPEHMLRLIETGIRSGNLAEVLTHLVEIDRTSFDLRRSVRMAVAYPLLLMVLCSMLLVFISMFIVPDLRKIFEDFRIQLPWTSAALFWFSGEKFLPFLGFGLAATTMIVVLSRVSLPPQHWRWMQTRVPLFGPMLLWRGIANWARLAGLLLKQGLPAPEAMRLAATGVNDALMAVEGLRLSRTLANGRSVAEGLQITGRLPASIVPLVRWGEENNALPEAFDTVAEMFENRLRIRAALLQSILPPLAFIFVALLGLWLANAMIMPLVSLISSLSGGSRRGGAPRGDEIDVTLYAAVTAATFVALLGAGLWIRMLGVIGRDPSKKSKSPTRLALAYVIKVFLWIFFFFSLLVLMASLAGVFGFLLWIFALIVALTVKIRHTDAERRALMWLLGTAVEKSVPLPTAARAFGEERNDGLGNRTRYLAFQLDRGVELGQAVQNARLRLPNEALVAVRTGYAVKSMTPLVRAMTKRDMSSDGVVHSLAAKLLYIAMFLFLATGIIVFVQIKILPEMIKILRDFNHDVPSSTLLLIDMGRSALPYAFLVFWIMAALLVGLIYVLLRYTGILHWDPPLVRQISLPLDQAIMLKSLAGAVEHNVPMSEMIGALAHAYPKGYIQMRLDNAGTRISRGIDWCDSLHDSGLLSKADAGVLKAAERVGNLAWALSELADRLSRRFVSRASAVLAIAFPIVLFFFAAVVFLVAYGLMDPLSQLIMSLA